MKSIICALVLSLLAVCGVAEDHWGEDWKKHNKEKCSSCLVIDSSITDECLSGVLPPYPICCLAQNATALIKKAQESSTRCCSPPAAADLHLCKCPVKDSEKFKSKIGDHCRAVAECPTLDSLTATVSVTNNNLRGDNIDMGKQIQREEYAYP